MSAMRMVWRRLWMMALVVVPACSWPCSAGPGTVVIPEGAVEAVTVSERWVSEADLTWDLDTPAVWLGDDFAWVLVTGKGSHDLKVFDAATGDRRPDIGGQGDGAGRFQRPNAVVVVGDIAFVVERDNHRVQVLQLPGGESLGMLGDEALGLPYGIASDGLADELTLWVTDAYEAPFGEATDPSQKLHRFRVSMGPEGVPEVVDHAVFGETEGMGALDVVESIGLDPESGHLLIADEEKRSYQLYDTTGAYLGREIGVGLVEGDPEGVALVTCTDDPGYWILTDQRRRLTIFHVLDRSDFRYVGSFQGEATARTDGVVFANGPVVGFEEGALFAVHADQALAAFAWRDIAEALDLDSGCGVH